MRQGSLWNVSLSLVGERTGGIMRKQRLFLLLSVTILLLAGCGGKENQVTEEQNVEIETQTVLEALEDISEEKETETVTGQPEETQESTGPEESATAEDDKEKTIVQRDRLPLQQKKSRTHRTRVMHRMERLNLRQPNRIPSRSRNRRHHRNRSSRHSRSRFLTVRRGLFSLQRKRRRQPGKSIFPMTLTGCLQREPLRRRITMTVIRQTGQDTLSFMWQRI